MEIDQLKEKSLKEFPKILDLYFTPILKKENPEIIFIDGTFQNEIEYQIDLIDIEQLNNLFDKQMVEEILLYDPFKGPVIIWRIVDFQTGNSTIKYEQIDKHEKIGPYIEFLDELSSIQNNKNLLDAYYDLEFNVLIKNNNNITYKNEDLPEYYFKIIKFIEGIKLEGYIELSGSRNEKMKYIIHSQYIALLSLRNINFEIQKIYGAVGYINENLNESNFELYNLDLDLNEFNFLKEEEKKILNKHNKDNKSIIIMIKDINPINNKTEVFYKIYNLPYYNKEVHILKTNPLKCPSCKNKLSNIDKYKNNKQLIKHNLPDKIMSYRSDDPEKIENFKIETCQRCKLYFITNHDSWPELEVVLK